MIPVSNTPKIEVGIGKENKIGFAPDVSYK
jgi:hypothetical protein